MTSTIDDADPAAWRVKPFDELNPAELYDILELRQRVFVIEQNSVFREIDHLDQAGLHLFRRDGDGRLCAYLRILPPGVPFAEGSLGRIVASPELRGTGAGAALMRQGIAIFASVHGPGPIRIGAQARLRRFYEKFGFAVASEPYDDGGIEHIEMLRPGGAEP